MNIELLESPQPVPALTYIGDRTPVHCTSSGKVLLAFHEAAYFQQIIADGLTRYTPNTVTDPGVLQKQLADIRESDFCYCESEYLQDMVSFGAPIRNYSKIVVAAVSLIMPIQRMQPQSVLTMKNKVMKAAKEISKNLGYSSR